MQPSTATTARRAVIWGRIIAIVIGLPIYTSFLTTLPALAAGLVVLLYLGIPHAVQRAVTDPVHPDLARPGKRGSDLGP